MHSFRLAKKIRKKKKSMYYTNEEPEHNKIFAEKNL